MKKQKPTLQMLFLVLSFAQIPQTFQEQVETKAAVPVVELPESKGTSVDFRKLVSAKMASEQKTEVLLDDPILDREGTLDKSYSNAETTESSSLDGTVDPVLDEPTKTMEDAEFLLAAPGMSWTEASGMMTTNEKPVENLRPRSSYSSGGSSGDDDDDEEDDEASGVAVIVVVIGVGIVALLAVLVLAIWWCRKRRNAQKPSSTRYREVSPQAPPEVPARVAYEEALLDDKTQNEGT